MRLPFSTTTSSYYHHHHHHHHNNNINYYFKSFLTFFQPSSSYSSLSTCHNNNIITRNNNNNNNNNNINNIIITTHMEPPSTKPDPPPISTTTTTVRRHRKRKIIIIMGPTGAGKSRLSVDLITKYFPTGEIINSDKMQVYSGLNITTNKITPEDQLRVPHHLLGAIDPTKPVFTTSEFRKLASEYVNEIKSRRGLPFVVGGSNSLIYSLVTKRYDPSLDVFNGPDPSPVSLELRYDCCFIWVDVCLPVLNQYLHKRVDEMLDSGMFEELVEYFGSGQNTRVNKSGLGQAIGVPEFEAYFEKFGESEVGFGESEVVGNGGREVVYEEVVRRIKDNTCQLAKKQVSKILRLRDAGWDLKRVDATEAFRAAMMMTSDSGGGGGGTRVAEVWEKHVVEPSMNIVKQFLDE